MKFDTTEEQGCEVYRPQLIAWKFHLYDRGNVMIKSGETKGKEIKKNSMQLYEQQMKGGKKISPLSALFIFKTGPMEHKSPKSNQKADRIKYRRKESKMKFEMWLL